MFILRSPRGSKLLTFGTITEARQYRDRVQTDRARFQIIKQTIVEEPVQ